MQQQCGPTQEGCAQITSNSVLQVESSIHHKGLKANFTKSCSWVVREHVLASEPGTKGSVSFCEEYVVESEPWPQVSEIALDQASRTYMDHCAHWAFQVGLFSGPGTRTWVAFCHAGWSQGGLQNAQAVCGSHTHICTPGELRRSWLDADSCRYRFYGFYVAKATTRVNTMGEPECSMPTLGGLPLRDLLGCGTDAATGICDGTPLRKKLTQDERPAGWDFQDKRNTGVPGIVESTLRFDGNHGGGVLCCQNP